MRQVYDDYGPRVGVGAGRYGGYGPGYNTGYGIGGSTPMVRNYEEEVVTVRIEMIEGHPGNVEERARRGCRDSRRHLISDTRREAAQEVAMTHSWTTDGAS